MQLFIVCMPRFDGYTKKNFVILDHFLEVGLIVEHIFRDKRYKEVISILDNFKRHFGVTSLGLFINYVTLFWTISDPLPPP